jgi:hypothetical protein
VALDINTKTKAFLDRKAVQDAVGKGAAQALNQYGYVVRTHARKSMRPKKGPSAPGTPPHAHGKRKGVGRGPLLKKFLFSEFDLTTKSMVIGPSLLLGSKFRVPELHEHGGSITKKVRVPPPPRTPPLTQRQKDAYAAGVKSGRIVPKRHYIQVTKAYPARPFMRPALAATMPQFPSLYANTVKP